jgi:nucleoid-associated protein EbfC
VRYAPPELVAEAASPARHRLAARTGAALKALTGTPWAVAIADEGASLRSSSRRKWPRNAFAPKCFRTPRVARLSMRSRSELESFSITKVHDPMPNLEEIMKMAQDVQAEMQKAQDNLDKIEVEGAAGGGLVKVRASAKGRIIASISTKACSAVGKVDARGSGRRRDQRRRTKADAAAAPELQKMTSGIPLPPGFKLPF